MPEFQNSPKLIKSRSSAMYSTTALVLGMFWTVNSELHSLTYIYTALSKPLNLPGVHEFTAMGLLDDKMIDYYDSADRKKVPKQSWMAERMEPDYWEKGTQSRKSKEQWFKVNVEILMERMRQNHSDVHILQWKHGCIVEEQKDHSFSFIRGMDQYSYDGEDFLSFDDSNMRWIAPAVQARQTKQKWDNVPILNQYTKGYLEKECVDWLKKFSEYGNAQLRKSSPPTVYSFAKQSKTTEGQLVLTCMATGFLPKSVTMEIRKNGIALKEVHSTGVRPNNDGTYQIRKCTVIPGSSNEEYDCYVNHETLSMPVIQKWDKTCTDCSTSMALAAGIAVAVTVVFVAGVLVILYKMKRIVCLGCSASEPDSANKGTNPPGAVENLLLKPAVEPPPPGSDVTESLLTKDKSPKADEKRDSGFLGTDASSTESGSSDSLGKGGEST